MTEAQALEMLTVLREIESRLSLIHAHANDVGSVVVGAAVVLVAALGLYGAFMLWGGGSGA